MQNLSAKPKALNPNTILHAEVTVQARLQRLCHLRHRFSTIRCLFDILAPRHSMRFGLRVSGRAVECPWVLISNFFTYGSLRLGIWGLGVQGMGVLIKKPDKNATKYCSHGLWASYHLLNGFGAGSNV